MLEEKIYLIKDKNARDVLMEIVKELKRIKSIPPVKEDLKQITYVINKITGKLK